MRNFSKMIACFALAVFILVACSCTPSDSGEDVPEEQVARSTSSPEPAPITPPPGITVELPEGWPESIPIMEGFFINYSNSSDEGNKLNVIANGNIDIDEATNFYASLDGWKNDVTQVQGTTGDQRDLSLVREDNETEKVLILISLNDSGLTYVSIFYTKGATNIGDDGSLLHPEEVEDD